ncbi:hypothetical protein TWF696_006717 [Orbilia brochopaga]|uniref:Uncharacterized protein n=1 Tax=Orbilia brochopaga TaxID=3140254 RepID=A0AAV9UQL4_9PEZI
MSQLSQLPSPGPAEPIELKKRRKAHPKPVPCHFVDAGSGRDPASLVGKHMVTRTSYDGGESGFFAFDVVEEKDPVVLVSDRVKAEGWKLGYAQEGFRMLKAAARGKACRIMEARTVAMARYKRCIGPDGLPIAATHDEVEAVIGLAFKLEGMAYTTYFWCERAGVCDAGDGDCEHYGDLWIADSGEIEVKDITNARDRALVKRANFREIKKDSTWLLINTAKGTREQSSAGVESGPPAAPVDLTGHPEWHPINSRPVPSGALHLAVNRWLAEQEQIDPNANDTSSGWYTTSDDATEYDPEQIKEESNLSEEDQDDVIDK